jgi:tetratricopeptide (TPR) repeat protein
MLSGLKIAKIAFNEDPEKQSCFKHSEVHALLELNALLDTQPDCWVAYCLRGKINADLGRYLEAISDYTQALKISKTLNGRNRIGLLKNIAIYADKLSARQSLACSRSSRKHTCTLPKKSAIGKNGRGRIKNLGMFLFDASEIEKLIQLYRSGDDGESTMRWLTTYSF